ncbi:MAG: helix-turn-helix domain-containing protein [Novosphingobium sp.]|jgi:HTH-type transcriptional regulator/antitoxin HigA|nr:helix-turn-helix domain-containing protein [Novosphingobium sp.]
MNGIDFDTQCAAERWNAFVAEVPVRPIRSDADYDQMVALMNQLLDVVGDNESHPLAPVLALIGDQVAGYDSGHFAIPRSEPREVLRYLMDQQGLKQSDLGDVLAQPNVSAILNGHRSISRDVAKALAQRFNVAVDVFL